MLHPIILPLDHDVITVRLADWPADAEAIRRVRSEVFILEQKVPKELEWDDRDAECEHALATTAAGAVATGRLLPDGHIGRMAVLKAWRGLHIGSAVLELLIARGRHQGFTELLLSSQIHALEFYRHFGFTVEGATYLEAGILHQNMCKKLG